MQHRIKTLLKLEEEHEEAKNKLFERQGLVKRWFDKKAIGSKYF